MATSRGGAAAGKSIHEQLVDALEAVFGVRPGFRPVHAKGVICEGTFQPAREAATLTRAPHARGRPVPVTLRFSDNTGIPAVPDGDPSASPRGLAIRFHLSDGSSTDIVAHSYNGFAVRTPEEFLELLRAVAASSPGTASPTPLEAFLSTHPRARRHVEAPKPIPLSFGTITYYAVDAFRFTNPEGRSRFGRYRIVPAAGEHVLDPAEAAGRGPNFLFEELAERLERSAVEFRILVQLAAADDPVDDASAPWPDDRPAVELGTLRVIRLVAGSDAVQRQLGFDPGRLPDGIEPSGDPLVEARSAVYAIAARRRAR